MAFQPFPNTIYQTVSEPGVTTQYAMTHIKKT